MSSQIMALAESLGVTQRDITNGLRRGVVSESEVVSTAQLLRGAWQGNDRVRFAVNEALTTSDLFRNATGDVLDREMLAEYQTAPRQWDKFAARTMVNDFRPKKLIDLIAGRGPLPRVPEHSNYPEADYATAERTISVHKNGEQFGYTFEMKVNDQLNELQKVPASWAARCVATEDFAALESLANPLTGAPNTAVFNSGNGNLGNLALTSTNVQSALTALRTKRDASGVLLYPGELMLVVGPAQALAAQAIVNTTTIKTTVNGVETTQNNPLAGLRLVILDTLPGTAWFILPVPTAARPAMYVAFLRGYETPDVRYKNDQGQRAGGGSIGADEGSFDDDTVYWRVRHIVGGAPGDPMFAYASVPA